MIELIGKIVEVETADMIYVGKLVEIGEVDVHLEAESGWVIVPVERILSIKKKD